MVKSNELSWWVKGIKRDKRGGGKVIQILEPRERVGGVVPFCTRPSGRGVSRKGGTSTSKALVLVQGPGWCFPTTLKDSKTTHIHTYTHTYSQTSQISDRLGLNQGRERVLTLTVLVPGTL